MSTAAINAALITNENERLRLTNAELLEALKQAYFQIIVFLNEGDFKRDVEFDAGYIVDAIAKAEGNES